MREITFPESGPKRKLLDAAEQLFAERGFETVSVRDIAQLAQANVAAVNYHFGSRDALLTLVMLRCLTPVNDERTAMLETLVRNGSGKAVVLEQVIEALVRPLVAQVSRSTLSERLFYKLVGRIFAQQGDGLPAPVEEQMKKVSDQFKQLFASKLPTISPEELTDRIHFMMGGMIHLLTHQDLLPNSASSESDAPTMETTLARFVRYAAAGLREGVERQTTKEPMVQIVSIQPPPVEEPAATAAPVGVTAKVRRVEVPAVKGPQVMFDF